MTIYIDPNCPPEIEGLIRDRAGDERVVAMNRWLGPTKARKPQEPCDLGLFGDAHQQQELKL